MSTVQLHFDRPLGKIKPMNAVNNGPLKPSSKEQTRGNFDDFKAARIPFVRNHDASFCAAYGGEHTVDVHAIFPDFNANPYDDRSYDFALTDGYLSAICDAGSAVYYRLGSKIEHWVKQYGTVVPGDFRKWSVVCEHIIRHYTEGWANGFYMNIPYWEIWNEADGISADGNQPNWTGTPQEYYELYVTAAKHLKSRFPHLKIGGPAISWCRHQPWLDDFLAYVKENHAPLDFFSWHSYNTDPHLISEHAAYIRERLDTFGFFATESHCNEWNYIEGWGEKYLPSIQCIHGIRGAAYVAAVMTEGQKSSLDMLMYYDARIATTFNGMFDFYTLEPLKGYYPFVMFADLAQLGTEAETETDDDELYALASTDGKQNRAMVIYYPTEKTASEKTVTIPGAFRFRGIVTDETHTYTEIPMSDTVTLAPNSILYLEER